MTSAHPLTAAVQRLLLRLPAPARTLAAVTVLSGPFVGACLWRGWAFGLATVVVVLLFTTAGALLVCSLRRAADGDPWA